MTNKYLELKQKHQEEINKFPFAFAFNNEQFKEGMEKLGLKETDTDKVVSIGAGGFIRKTDVPAMEEMFEKQKKEHKEMIEADKTGEGYIKEMFAYELMNHEYGYTGDLEPTLSALNLTYVDVQNNEILKHGLKLAKEELIKQEEEQSKININELEEEIEI